MGSLSRKILVRMAAIGLLPLLVMSVLGYYAGLPAMRKAAEHHLNSTLEARMFSISRYLTNIRMDLYAASRCQCALGACGGDSAGNGEGVPVCHLLDTLIISSKFYREMAIYKTDWTLMAGSQGADRKAQLAPEIRKMAATRGFVISPPRLSADGTVVFQAGYPAFTKEGKVRAYVVATIDLTQAILPFLWEAEGAKEYWKLYMVGLDGNYIVPPGKKPGPALGPSGLPRGFLQGPYGSVRRYRDWRGVQVLGVAERLPDTEWVLVAEEDETQGMAYIRKFLLLAGVTGLFTVAMVFAISWSSSQRLLRPLRELARVARSISQGQRRKRAPIFQETEVQEMGAAFNQMLDQIEIHQGNLVNAASLAAVGELSSSIVHEMRNPLSSIKMNLKTLGEKVQDDPMHKVLAQIALQQTDRLETMLAELLNFGKPLRPTVGEAVLQRICRDVIDSLGERAGEKRIEIRINDALGERPIRVDRELLVRALTNLVDNAIRWSPEGGTISVEAAPADDGRTFSLTVRDGGPGLPEAGRDKLFRPFYSTREDGIGLGLAYVKKIVEYHGGTVDAANAAGGGALFTLTLPIGGPEGQTG